MVFPKPDQKANQIALLLVDELLPLFGVSEALLLDWGTKYVCQLLSIKTTTYHPQCNGIVE